MMWLHYSCMDSLFVKFSQPVTKAFILIKLCTDSTRFSASVSLKANLTT